MPASDGDECYEEKQSRNKNKREASGEGGAVLRRVPRKASLIVFVRESRSQWKAGEKALGSECASVRSMLVE